MTLAAILIAGLLVPLGSFASPIHFTGDLILFAYLFGLARFFTTSAALNTGSPFEGMGAAREVTFACFSEPAIFLAFLVLAKLSGSLSLNLMLHAPLTVPLIGMPVASLVLVAAGLLVVVLAENSRIPIDDPNTHLELTMIHEVMVLDHSGPLLGLILYGAAIKLFVLSAVLLHVLLPFQSGWAIIDWPLFAGRNSGSRGPHRLDRVRHGTATASARPKLLVAASLLCAFGVPFHAEVNR